MITKEVAEIVQTKRGKIEKVENDSDDVYDLGKVKHKFFKKHEIHDSHSGWFTVDCPKSGHSYLHLVHCPNKYTNLCRGCGAEI